MISSDTTPDTWPTDPIAAVVHADPYPYYASLVDGPHLAFDPRLRLWIAASASAVDAVLSDPRCRVRPLREPVPAAIVSGPAGEVFARLVRMNEGADHASPKLALQRALASVAMTEVEAKVRGFIARQTTLPHTAEALSAWTFALPVSVVASILGFADDELAQVSAWTSDFVACLSPLSGPVQIADAHAAADRLLVRMKALVDVSTGDSTTLVGTVAREARAVGWDRADAIVANLIGLLSQTFDATAGLIGNTIRALLLRPDTRAEAARQPTRLSAFVDEVSRHDPSVQNTRRFVSEDMMISGTALQAGDAILVLLAAANRDPAANVDPHAFRIDRPNRRIFSFGHARHQCPGQTLACTIAATAVSELLPVDVPMLATPLEWGFRPSANARIPVFIDRAALLQHR